MTIRKAKTVCLCNGVTAGEILKILKKGARDLNDVKKFTLASASCGKCKVEVETVINHYFAGKTPEIQKSINFKNQQQ
jgi:nitrite reductase (NADH) large subunit